MFTGKFKKNIYYYYDDNARHKPSINIVLRLIKSVSRHHIIIILSHSNILFIYYNSYDEKKQKLLSPE